MKGLLTTSSKEAGQSTREISVPYRTGQNVTDVLYCTYRFILRMESGKLKTLFGLLLRWSRVCEGDNHGAALPETDQFLNDKP